MPQHDHGNLAQAELRGSQEAGVAGNDDAVRTDYTAAHYWWDMMRGENAAKPAIPGGGNVPLLMRGCIAMDLQIRILGWMRQSVRSARSYGYGHSQRKASICQQSSFLCVGRQSAR